MQLKTHCDHRISYHHTNFISQVQSKNVLTSVEVPFRLRGSTTKVTLLRTFKLNSQYHDSAPLMAFETKVKATFENDGDHSTN